MAQADQTVQNSTFPTVRADINSNLAALFSNNSGTTAPSTTVAYMDWIDTSGANPVWKKRNAANNAWITVATISGSTIAVEGALPSQSGQSGKFLTTNGTVASWGVPPSSTKEVFNSSGTWAKPATGTVAMVVLWGGGGSGARYDTADVSCGGGGGGACAVATFQLSDLPSTVTVTIGAGGASIASPTIAAGNNGGTSSFGTLLSAYGGGGGQAGGPTSLASGGGGGGVRSAGTSVSATGGLGGSGYSGATAGGKGGFRSGVSTFVPPEVAEYGGGGGGAYTTAGADALYGGGGGGGAYIGDSRAGGNSVVGGDGGTGNTGTAGSVPGGGGGGTVLTGTGSGAGGAGRCIVYVW